MDLQQAFDTGFEAVKRYVDEGFATLEGRVAALEARPPMKYLGVWDTAKRYVPGNFCTHDGSLWHAEQESCGVRPGDGSTSWKLAVKKGGNR